MIIPQDLLFLVSLIVTSISHYLRDAALPKLTNALIAGISIVLIVIMVMLATSGFTSDIKADALLFCTTLVSLFSALQEMNDLVGYLQDAATPLMPKLSYDPLVRRKSVGETVHTPIVFPQNDDKQ